MQKKREYQSGGYWLCAGWSSVDLDEPHFEALVHHEVEPKELEALVGEVLGADCRLDTCQTAPVAADRGVILQTSASQYKHIH